MHNQRRKWNPKCLVKKRNANLSRPLCKLDAEDKVAVTNWRRQYTTSILHSNNNEMGTYSHPSSRKREPHRSDPQS